MNGLENKVTALQQEARKKIKALAFFTGIAIVADFAIYQHFKDNYLPPYNSLVEYAQLEREINEEILIQLDTKGYVPEAVTTISGYTYTIPNPQISKEMVTPKLNEVMAFQNELAKSEVKKVVDLRHEEYVDNHIKGIYAATISSMVCGSFSLLSLFRIRNKLKAYLEPKD